MRVTMVAGRCGRLAVLLVTLSLASAAFASEVPECGCDPLPAPVQRPYRREPEENAIALAVLSHYFKGHPPAISERPCVTLPGHRALPREAMEHLAQAGLQLERRADCRYEEGRIIWGATGVWRTGPTEFVAHVTKAEFGHVSLFLQGYEYALEGAGGTLRVRGERPSPCNPAEKAKRRPGGRARADAERGEHAITGPCKFP